MSIMITALGLALILGNGFLQLPATGPQAAPQLPQVQQLPSTPIGVAGEAVQITHGPVVENVTDTTAEIAWSTNVNSGTALHYGTDPACPGEASHTAC